MSAALRDLAAAYRAGLAAVAAGGPRRNPYRGDSPDRVERLRSAMWARGYSAGNPLRDRP